jgi:hypothetical protein
LHSRLRSFCDEISATLARLLAYIGAVAVIAAAAAKVFGVPGVEASVDHAARPDWIAVERPHRAFVLLLPEFPNEPEPSYAMHRHASGGGRKDILSWGEPESPGSRLLIEIYRPGSGLKSLADLSTVAMVSAETLGTVMRVKPVEPVPSKFGSPDRDRGGQRSENVAAVCKGRACPPVLSRRERVTRCEFQA